MKRSVIIVVVVVVALGALHWKQEADANHNCFWSGVDRLSGSSLTAAATACNKKYNFWTFN